MSGETLGIITRNKTIANKPGTNFQIRKCFAFALKVEAELSIYLNPLFLKTKKEINSLITPCGKKIKKQAILSQVVSALK